MDKKHILPYATKKEIIEELNSLNIFTPNIEGALNIAEKAHKNQKRDNGKPYLTEHIFPIVRSLLSKYQENEKLEEMIITVLLHDVIEDSDCISLEEINDLFGSKIAENIELLTKPKNKSLKKTSQEKKFETNKKMVEKLDKANKIVKIIKLEDRLNNIASTKNIASPKYARYLKETKEIYIPFAKMVSNYYVEKLKTQINRLEEK